MSSLPRRMQRKVLRQRSDYEPAPVPYKDLPCGGYMVLRPTKGWRRVTAPRLRAMARMAEILG